MAAEERPDEQGLPLFGEKGHRPVVPQEEIDKLLAALRSVAGRMRRVSAERPLTVSLFDFRDTVQLSPEHLHALQSECQALCRVLRRTLVPYLNTDVDLRLLSVAVASFDQFSRSLAPTPIIGVFRLARRSSLGFWEITPPVAFAIIQYMLGARELSPPPTREITSIEASVLSKFFEELLSTWVLTWPALKTQRPQMEFVTSTFAKIDMRRIEQNVVHVVLQIRVGEVEGAMNIGLPVGPTRALLQNVSRRDEDSTVGVKRSAVSGMVGRVEVEVSVRLPAVMMQFCQLSSLRPGELLPLGLHADAPLVVAVNGAPKFVGEAGISDEHMAVRIKEVLK